MDISDITEQQIIDLIEFDNQDLVDIPNFPNYKFNIKTNKVYSKYKNKYLKPNWEGRYYNFTLYNNKKPHTFGLHRLVYICNNPMEDISQLQIDHIDCDKTNNNIENLRTVSNSQNQMNIKVHTRNKLGHKNIRKFQNGYRVDIVLNGKQYNKCIKTLEEAIIWRDNKRIELHKEFGRE